MEIVQKRRERPSTARVLTQRWEGNLPQQQPDSVAVEEPLEIRLAGCSIAVTMRTPGDDFDLAVGFLFTEGIIQHAAEIASIAHCIPDDPSVDANIVNLNPIDPSTIDPTRWNRNFYATSSCGICGKASIAAVKQEAVPIRSDLRLTSDVLSTLDGKFSEHQALFGKTGGLHAAALFDSTGRLLTIREDVGRHNAVDKVIGDALQNGWVPLHNRILLVSSRASFEIVQKALMAGIPVVVAVSAPSSLAIDLAREAGMTLVGFLRGGRFNVYAGHDRVRVAVLTHAVK